MKKVFFAILLFVSSLAYAADVDFAILTDTHIGRDGADAKLRKAIRSINADPDIDFILVLGDISDHGTVEELTYAREILSELDKPYYFTTGNHDARWPERREAFREVFRKDRFCFRAGGVKFIGFSTGPFETIKRASVRESDLKWIRKKSRGNSPVVVAVHYPPDLVYNKEAVSAAFKGSDIILWLAGHLRFNKVRGEDPYPSIINVSTLEQGSYNKIRLSDSDARFFIVTPEDGKETLWYGTEIRH